VMNHPDLLQVALFLLAVAVGWFLTDHNLGGGS